MIRLLLLFISFGLLAESNRQEATLVGIWSDEHQTCYIVNYTSNDEYERICDLDRGWTEWLDSVGFSGNETVWVYSCDGDKYLEHKGNSYLAQRYPNRNMC